MASSEYDVFVHLWRHYAAEKTRQWLEQNDPKALEQLDDAIDYADQNLTK